MVLVAETQENCDIFNSVVGAGKLVWWGRFWEMGYDEVSDELGISRRRLIVHGDTNH